MPICKHNKHVAHGPVFHIYTNFFGHSGSFYFMENEAWQSIQIQFLQAVMCRITWPQLWNLLFLKHRIDEVSWKTEQGRTTACVCVRVCVNMCCSEYCAFLANRLKRKNNADLILSRQAGGENRASVCTGAWFTLINHFILHVQWPGF